MTVLGICEVSINYQPKGSQCTACKHRIHIITDTNHQGEKYSIYKDAKKVEQIILAVHTGRTNVSRLATADKLLTKWGF